MSKQPKQLPFQAEQFTPTEWDSAEDKAKWANAMASWVQRGFPENGWKKSLYHHLYQHMYGHIAHYNQYGFYAEWFANIHLQLEWLQYAAKGGAYGMVGDPSCTWCDVERAFSTWIRESGLLVRYQQLCAQDIEARERAQLARLQQKYASEGDAPVQALVTREPVALPPATTVTTPHQSSSVSKRKRKPPEPHYVPFSLFEEVTV